MNNKNTLYFLLGTFVGAFGGSGLTYFFIKDRFEAEKIEAIEEYAEHAEKRLERQIEALKDESVGDLDKKLGEKLKKSVDDPEEEEIRNNEGVKKYHHYNGEELPEYASKRIFKKTTKEEEMAKKENSEIVELKEQEYLDFAGEKQTIDVLFHYENDAIDEIWGYQTDNQTTCQARFGKGLIDLIGIDGEDMLDWFEPDEGVVVRYFLNKEMNTAFEVVVHCDPETYYSEPES